MTQLKLIKTLSDALSEVHNLTSLHRKLTSLFSTQSQIIHWEWKEIPTKQTNTHHTSQDLGKKRKEDSKPIFFHSGNQNNTRVWKFSKKTNTKGFSQSLQHNQMVHVKAESGCTLWIRGTRENPTLVNIYFKNEKESSNFFTLPLLESICSLIKLSYKSSTSITRLANISKTVHNQVAVLNRELEENGHDFQITTQDEKVLEILNKIKTVSNYPTPVLIQGESGTGKELVAKNIHELSNRKSKPFLQVNCGAFPDSIIESELFGHEAGAFTGANKKHIGLFERAHGGTLFLDEIGELNSVIQPKLLRVLQEGIIYRVGGEEPIKVDVRIVSATNKDLENMVEDKLFRSDLLFRLNVFPLYLPPLRERVNDLGILTNHLIQKIAGKLNKKINPLNKEQIENLESYQWPGNIRELQNYLERSIILSESENITLVPLPQPSKKSITKDIKFKKGVSFDDYNKMIILKSLIACKWKVFGPGGAAELLELNPSTFQSKMRKYNIRRT